MLTRDVKRRHNLVPPPLADRLEGTCRAAVGDGLRSITYFTPEAYEQVYLRADLEPDADMERVVAHEAKGFEAREAYAGSELGSYEHTVRSFRNGYVTRVTGPERGVFVTSDGLTLRGANEVASALSALLSGLPDRRTPAD